MKKIILLISLCVISMVSVAQNDKVTPRQPVKGDKTISFNFAGIATTTLTLNTDPLNQAQLIDFRYFMYDDLALRIGLGLNNLTTTTTTTNDSTGGLPLIETSNKNKATGFSIGLGVERHFKTTSKTIDPFIGPGIYVTKLGKNKVTATNKSTMANGDYTDTRTETINPGGFVLGVAVNAGFFWYFTQSLALGASFSIGYGTGSVGGDTDVTNTVTNSTGGVITTTETTTTTVNKTKLSALRTMNTGTINLLVKF